MILKNNKLLKNKKIMKNKKILCNTDIRQLTPKTFLKNHVYDDITEICKKKNKRKIKTDEFEIPRYCEYECLVKKNFNISQLKSISRFFNQKVTGNKKQLIYNLYNYLKYSYFCIKIQKIYRSHLIKRFFKLHGPSVFSKKCINEKDFLTFTNIKDIPFYQLYTYKDKDGFIYGFDICSIYNMLKSGDYSKNPYNRNDLPKNMYKEIKSIIKLSKRLNYPINIKLEDDTENMSEKKKLELEAISVFQTIDSMGFITDSNWLMNLSRSRCVRYIRELEDVWNYRAQIEDHIKREIIPPHGRLFFGLGNISSLIHTSSDLKLKKVILKLVNRLISKGVNQESKSLGCFYALGTFTIVSQSASNSLPWLYESFLLNN